MRKWWKRLGCTMAVLLLIGAVLAWDGRVLAMIRFAGEAHQPSWNPDFARLERLLPPGNASLAGLHEGLSHPYSEKAKYIRELWTTSNRSIHGYRFYSKPFVAPPAAQARILDILSRKESFQGYRGPKMCGGYHADFAARLESEGKSTWFLVCLGCGEVLIESGGDRLICELEETVELEMEEAWKDCLGVPYTTLGTRFPIGKATLEEWGFLDIPSNYTGREEVRTKDEVQEVFERGQQLVINPSKRAVMSWVGSMKLTEKTHPTGVLAEQEMKEELEAAARREANYKAAGRSLPGVQKQGFVHGNQVYWVWGREVTSEDLTKAVGLLRGYCEKTAPHEVRYYE